MKTQNAVRVIMGSNVLVSAALTYFVHPLWVLYTVFVGAAILQSAFTGICPGEKLVRRLGCDDGSCGVAAGDGVRARNVSN